MGVTYVGVSNAAAQTAGTTTTASTTAITPTLPSGTANGDRVFVFQSASNTSAASPTGWTAVYKDVQVGPTGTAPGAGTGRRYISCHYRDKDDTWTAIPSFALTSATQNTHAAAAVTIRKGGNEFWTDPTASSPGNKSGASTAYSVTIPSFATTTGAFLFTHTATNDNVTASGQTLTQSGATFANVAERADGGLATGNDVSIKVGTADVSVGATATLTRTGTLSAASEGGTAVVQQQVTAFSNAALPTLVATYVDREDASNLTALTTPTFTPAAGEVIVVKAVSANSTTGWNNLPTATGLTFTRVVYDATSQYCSVGIWTAIVGASPTAMSISLTPSGSAGLHSMLVERWADAQLDASPATNATKTGAAATAPSATLTTTANNSVVSWICGDWSAQALSGAAYRSGAVNEYSLTVSGEYTVFFALQEALTAGSQTIGMTAPTQKWTMLGIEIERLVTETTYQGAVSLSVATTLTSAGDRTTSGVVNLNGSASLSTNGIADRPGAVGLTVGSSLTAAGARTVAASAALSAVGGLSADATRVILGGANLAASVSLAAGLGLPGGSVGLPVVGALSVAGTRSTSGAVSLSAASALSSTAVLTEFASVALSALGSLSVAGVRSTPGGVVLAALTTLTSAVGGIGGASTLTATVTLTTNAFVVRTGAVSLSPTGSLSVGELLGVFGSVSLSALAALSSAGIRTTAGGVSLSTVPTLTATVSSLTSSGVVSLSVLSTLTAGIGGAGGTAVLSISYALVANGVRVQLGTVNLLSTNGFTANGVLGAFGIAQLTALSSLSVVGRVGFFGLSALNALGNLAVGGTLVKTGSISLLVISSLGAASAIGIRGSVSLVGLATLTFVDLFPAILFGEGGAWISVGVQLSEGRKVQERVAWSTEGIHLDPPRYSPSSDMKEWVTAGNHAE